MYSVRANLPVCAGGRVHQLSTTCSTTFGIASCLRLSECVEWVRSHACSQWHACWWIPCMRSTTPFTMSTSCQLLRWIFNLYERSFIRECMLHPLLFLLLLQLIIFSMQLHVLPWFATSAHATPSLFHSLSSCDLHVTPSPHSLSFQSCFHH